MKISILFLFFFSSVFAQTDANTRWKVSYNKNFLKEFHLNQDLTIKLKAADYKTGDYLTIVYTDSKPCVGCSYELNIIKEGKMPVYILNTKSKYKPMQIPLKEIMEEFKFSRLYNLFIVYFTEISKKGKRDSGMRLLNIEIE